METEVDLQAEVEKLDQYRRSIVLQNEHLRGLLREARPFVPDDLLNRIETALGRDPRITLSTTEGQ